MFYIAGTWNRSLAEKTEELCYYMQTRADRDRPDTSPSPSNSQVHWEIFIYIMKYIKCTVWVKMLSLMWWNEVQCSCDLRDGNQIQSTKTKAQIWPAVECVLTFVSGRCLYPSTTPAAKTLTPVFSVISSCVWWHVWLFRKLGTHHSCWVWQHERKWTVWPWLVVGRRAVWTEHI